MPVLSVLGMYRKLPDYYISEDNVYYLQDKKLQPHVPYVKFPSPHLGFLVGTWYYHGRCKEPWLPT